ncbi:MAG TPA: hypothetical protein VMV49_05415 [Candidatus Deferrimicrobium sp.]|nr:hypothetical protein [Candidatus Deferrimicrobium sp.]
MHFKPYSRFKLRNILKNRVERAFTKDAISKETLELIVDFAAESGNADYAL